MPAGTYKILSATSMAALEALVQSALADGQDHVGGVCVETVSGVTTYYQAVH